MINKTPVLLTFTVVQRVQLLYVCVTKAPPLAKLHVRLFDGFYRSLAILGKRMASIMHQAPKVVNGAKIVELAM